MTSMDKRQSPITSNQNTKSIKIYRKTDEITSRYIGFLSNYILEVGEITDETFIYGYYKQTTLKRYDDYGCTSVNMRIDRKEIDKNEYNDLLYQIKMTKPTLYNTDKEEYQNFWDYIGNQEFRNCIKAESQWR